MIVYTLPADVGDAPVPGVEYSAILDVHFISSLPVKQRPACTAWADKRPAQSVEAESYTTLAPDVVDDVSG